VQVEGFRCSCFVAIAGDVLVTPYGHCGWGDVCVCVCACVCLHIQRELHARIEAMYRRDPTCAKRWTSTAFFKNMSATPDDVEKVCVCVRVIARERVISRPVWFAADGASPGTHSRHPCTLYMAEPGRLLQLGVRGPLRRHGACRPHTPARHTHAPHGPLAVSVGLRRPTKASCIHSQLRVLSRHSCTCVHPCACP
jgi:hypothetical protein